jgi:hypothetical protein
MSRHAADNLFVFLLGIFAVFMLPGVANAQSLWELTPYEVQIFVAMDDVPQLSQQSRQDVHSFLDSRIETVVGASWRATISSAPPELAIAMLGGLESVKTSDLSEDSLEADKVILLGLSADAFGYHVAARELDCRTLLWGTTVSRDVPQPALVSSAAVGVVLAAFAPLAQIETVEGKDVTIHLQAAALPLRDP